MERKRQVEKGFAILEQAFAFITVLLVVSAAVDVTRFLQAYQALQAGVQSSLRKCYVTDGGCLIPKEVLTQPYFKVWQKPVKGFEQNYTANGWYLKLPNVKYLSPSARVLGSEQSSYARIKGELMLQRFPASGDIYYGLQLSELPKLESFDFRRSPFFSGSHLTQLDIGTCTIKDGSGNKVRSVERIGGSTAGTSATQIGSITCRIEPPVKSDHARYARCVEAYGDHASCDESWKTGTRVVLDIEGEGHGRNAPAGKVSVNISQNGNSSLKNERQEEDCAGYTCDYGGRVFTGWGAFNFVPRGLPLSNITESLLKGDSYAEFTKHNYIRVKYGEDFTVSLKLNSLESSPDEPVSWSVTAIKIYYIDYSAKTEIANCATPMRKSEVNAGATCLPSLPGREYLKPLTVYSLQIDSAHPLQTPTGQVRCMDPVTGTGDSKAGMCNAIGQSAMCNIDYVYRSSSSRQACGIYNDRSFECPDNFGIDSKGIETLNTGTGQYIIKDSPIAAAVCPVQRSGNLIPDAQLISTTWYEEQKPLPPIEKTLEAQDCVMLRNPSPGPLPLPHGKYKNFFPGIPTITGTANIGLGAGIDPRMEKPRDYRYSCAEVGVGSDTYAAMNSPDYGCDWATTDQTLVRKDMGMPVDYFFEGMEKQRSTDQREEIYYSGPDSLDACTDYEIKGDLAHLDKRTYLGLYAAGSTPASCTPVDPKDPTHREILPADMWCLFQSEEHVQTGGGGFEAGDTQSAADTGVTTIQKLFPAARFGCAQESAYCVTFEPPEPHVINGARVFQAGASIKVPLNLLLGGDIPIHITDSRTWEGEFAR